MSHQIISTTYSSLLTLCMFVGCKSDDSVDEVTS